MSVSEKACFNPSGSGDQDHPLTWALCVATLNRFDVLTACIDCALSQTRPPAEIVVVDASDDWLTHRDRCEALLADKPVRLTYLQAPRRSTAAQRNAAMQAATSDICFVIDDDSFMHPDCAAEIMRVYEHPALQEVVAVAASDGPPQGAQGSSSARKDGLVRDGRFKGLFKFRLFRFLWREIAMMSAERVFAPYDGAFRKAPPPSLASTKLRVSPVALIAGYKMTVRRSAGVAVMFEDALQSYCPNEDLDFSYRLSRHGYLLSAHEAKLYHHEVAASRIKRQTALLLSITDVAFLVAKNAADRPAAERTFWNIVRRRVLAELIKDGGSRRWQMGQFRAVFRAIPICREILRQPADKLVPWYMDKQLEILALGNPKQPQTRSQNNLSSTTEGQGL